MNFQKNLLEGYVMKRLPAIRRPKTFFRKVFSVLYVCHYNLFTFHQ